MSSTTPPAAPAVGMRRKPSQQRSRDVVARLLRAAEELFARRGYDRASVRDITEAAGVPKGSLYQFFRDKESLLDTLVAEYVDAIDVIFAEFDDAQQVPDPAGVVGPVEATTSYVVRSVVDLATRRPAFRAVFAGLAASGPLADAGERVRHRFYDRIAHALEVGMPYVSGHRRAAEVCTEITRGLLPSAIDEHGTVDEDLVAEIEAVLAAYLAHVKQRNVGPVRRQPSRAPASVRHRTHQEQP